MVFEETQLSYQELDERSNQLARYLLSQEGVKGEHNPLIAICVERSLEMIVGLLGILKAGGAYVPLDPGYPEERLAYMLEDSGAKLLLTQKNLTSPLSKYSGTLVHLDADWKIIGRRSNTPLKKAIDPNDLAYVIYTSGSTGRPKGVAVEHRQLNNFIFYFSKEISISKEDRLLAVTTLSFDIAGLEFYLPLSCGAQVVLLGKQEASDTNRIEVTLEHNKITLMQATPATWTMLQAGDWKNTQSIKILCGGEALSNSLATYLVGQSKDVWNLYGPTETVIWSASHRLIKGESFESIGTPISNTQIYMLDEGNQISPIGVAGELCIAGAGLARGYFNRPELTAEKFIYLGIHLETLETCPDEEIEDKAKDKEGFVRTRLYRTGDLARWLPDGNIEYLGRTDFQVKIRGFRIELGEIESRLLEHRDIREAVVGVTGEDEHKQLVAWVVVNDNAEEPDAEGLHPFLKENLPDYMVPAFYVPLDALPLTPNGKLDRKALPAPDGELFVHQYVAPSTATEELLAGIWQDLLGQEQVGIHDNFFERGGHSLIATQLVSRIRECFDIEFPLKGVFEFAQLKEMAANLDSSQYDSALPDIVPMPAGQVIPLSFAQQRLWFIDQLMGGESTVYNMPLALRMQGMVNVEALQQSFSDLVSRHDSLRMTFVTAKESGHAEQSGEVVLLPAFEPLERKDLSDLSADKQASTVQEQATSYLDQAFDLQSGPLFKARLLTLSEDEHVLLVNMHHIISDGWSMGILIRDLTALYQSRLDDTVSTPSPLAIQYQDYAYWQRQWLSGEILEQQLAYWKQQLQGAPELLELPTDRARPARQSYRGAAFESRISRETLDKLNQLSQKQGVTLFMTLLTAFNVLLRRHSGQDDICVGSPIANRHQPGTESQVGFFVNTLVLRSQFEGIETFEELLQQVHQTCLDAYSHQDVPFEQLVEELQPTRNMAINPLFQVMFVLQNTPDGGLSEEELGALADIALSTLDQEDAGARSLFDLTLSAAETEEGLFLEWEYNTDIFDEWRIEAMSKHFLLLLEELILKPKQNIEYIPLITAEQQQQLISWNDTAVDYPKDQTIIDLFREQARQHPNNTAVVFEETQLSYQELDERSNRLARYLLSQEGIKGEHNPLIAICVERSLEMIVGLLGILKAGGAYVPLDPDYPQERLAYMLGDSGARLLLTQSSLEDQLPEYTDTIVHLDTDWTQIERRSKTSPKVPIRAKDLAYVIYTSGSTGAPKGVAIEHKPLSNFLKYFGKETVFSDSDRLLAVTTLSFDIAGLEFYLPLVFGGEIILLDSQSTSNSERLQQALDQYQITIMQATPATWGILEASSWANTHKTKLLCGGEALSKGLAHYLLDQSTKVWNLYGPTETTIWSTVNRLGEGEASEYIGKPIANTQIHILDKSQQLVPIGVPGELCIAGSGLARGYLNQPQLTAEKFIYRGIHPETLAFCSDQELENKAKEKEGFVRTRLYRTGDLARWLPDGNIEYLGRTDFQVKIRGFRIELGEIESRLLEHSDIREAVVGVTGEDENKQLVAWIVCHDDGSDVGAEQLRPWLKDTLPEYMVPAFYVPLETLPLTPNGKIDRKALPDPDGELFVHQYVAPSTATEELLAEIWQDLLGQEQVGIHDNFFERGGHSLIATQLVSRIREHFDIEFPLKGVFEFAQLKEMALSVDKVEHRIKLPRIPCLKETRVFPLTYIQEKIWFLTQLDSQRNAYNIPLLVKINGILNKDILETSIRQLINKHRCLRYRILNINGTPMQEIRRNIDWEMDYFIKPIKTADINKYLDKGFDLTKDWLFRVGLFEDINGNFMLAIITHHIISDGVSMMLLINELKALYNSLVLGNNIETIPLPIQYNDYCNWQHSSYYLNQIDIKKNFWEAYLRQLDTAIKVPTDYIRSPKINFSGNSNTFLINKVLVKDLRKIVVGESISLFSILLSALSLTLSSWARQDRFIFGTVTSGRTHHDLEKLVGCFIEFVPIAINIQRTSSLRHQVLCIADSAVNALSNSIVPFQDIVDLVKPIRSVYNIKNPLYNVALLLQNYEDEEYPQDSFFGKELQAEIVKSSTVSAQLDLRFIAVPSSKGIAITCEYDTSLFNEQTIDVIKEYFLYLLQEIVKNDDISINEIKFPNYLKDQRAAYDERQISMYVVSSFTANNIQRNLSYLAHSYGCELSIEYSKVNQVFQELLNEKSPLYTSDRYNVLFIRWEDLALNCTDDLNKLLLNARMFLEIIENNVLKFKQLLIVRCSPSAKLLKNHEISKLLTKLNSELDSILKRLHSIKLLDMDELLNLYEINKVHDSFLEEQAHIPYTDIAFSTISIGIWKSYLASKQKPNKVIILDCDNTLWEGVCAEDGPINIRVEKQNREIQLFMKDQKKKGKLLVLCSKNIQKDVDDVFCKNKEMILKKEDFVTSRINWEPKSKNIISVAEELNIGLENIVFIDDSEIECEEVTKNAVGVNVLQLPKKSKDIKTILKRTSLFDSTRTYLKEDRTMLYKQENQRKQLKSENISNKQFIDELQIEITFEEIEERHYERSSELTFRTTQFNCTNRKYSVEELKQIIKKNKMIGSAVYVKDRFGSYGQVGLILYQIDNRKILTDTFLLSCRALGRGIEYKMIRNLEKTASKKEIDTITIQFQQTERNTPAYKFLRSLKVKEKNNGKYKIYELQQNDSGSNL